jgi:hypothetical protein
MRTSGFKDPLIRIILNRDLYSCLINAIRIGRRFRSRHNSQKKGDGFISVTANQVQVRNISAGRQREIPIIFLENKSVPFFKANFLNFAGASTYRH